MLKVRLLDCQQLIDDACALLYDTYIKHVQWKFEADNPSGLKVITRNKRKLLVDRFVDQAIWFGAFDGEKFIGCGRLCGLDNNNKFEVESYQVGKNVTKFLHKEPTLDITKIAVSVSYKHKHTVTKSIFLAMFKYAYETKNSLTAYTHNQYLKLLFERINFPLKVASAFKYEISDPMPVNMYYASYKNGDINRLMNELKHVDDNIKNPYSDVFKVLEVAASMSPALMYWHDKNGKVLGANEVCVRELGAGSKDKLVGYTPYDFHPKEVAEHILRHNELVMRTGEVMSQEETILDLTTGKTKVFTSIKAPLYDNDGNVIGIIGTSINITAEKDAERLRIENASYQAQRKAQEKLSGLMGKIIHEIQSYEIDLVNGEDGISDINKLLYQNVKFTKREEQVLYLLSRGKTPKEIARILGKIEDKNISPKTIASIINHKLYTKLDAVNYGQLIDKATKLQLIKFMPTSLADGLSKKLDEL